MLHKKIVPAHYYNLWANAELNLKAMDEYSYHCALKGLLR
jgi:hypothetical protein